MPVSGNDVGRSFRVLELSLCAQLRQLAVVLLDFDTDQDRQDHYLLAVRLIAGRFTEFSIEEVCYLVDQHMVLLTHDKLEHELCSYAEASQEMIDKLDQSVHVLVTDLAQSKKDAQHWRDMAETEIRRSTCKPATRAMLRRNKSLIRDITIAQISVQQLDLWF